MQWHSGWNTALQTNWSGFISNYVNRSGIFTQGATASANERLPHSLTVSFQLVLDLLQHLREDVTSVLGSATTERSNWEEIIKSLLKLVQLEVSNYKIFGRNVNTITLRGTPIAICPRCD